MRNTMGIFILITGILIAPDSIYAQNAGSLLSSLEHAIPVASNAVPMGFMEPNFGTPILGPGDPLPGQIPVFDLPNQPGGIFNTPREPIMLGQAPVLGGNPHSGGTSGQGNGHGKGKSHWDKPGEHGNFLDFAIEHFVTGQDSVLPVDVVQPQHGPDPHHGGAKPLPGISKSVDPSHGVPLGHTGEMLGSAMLPGSHGDPHGSATLEFGTPLGAAAVHAKKKSSHWDAPGKHGNFLDFPVEHVVVDPPGPPVDPHGQLPIDPHGQLPIDPHGQIPVDPHGQLPVGMGEMMGGAAIHGPVIASHDSQHGGFGEPLGAASVNAKKKSSHWDPPGKHGNFLDFPIEHVVPHPEPPNGIPGKHGPVVDIPVEHVVPNPEPPQGPHNPILADFGKLISEPIIDGLHGNVPVSGDFGNPLGAAAIHGKKKKPSHFDMPGKHGNFLDIPVEHIGPHPIQSGAGGHGLPGTIDPHSPVASDIKVRHVDTVLSGQIDITMPKPKLSGSDYMSKLTQGYGRSRTKPKINEVPKLSPVIDNAVIRNPVGMSVTSPMLETHKVKLGSQSVVPKAVVHIAPSAHLQNKVPNKAASGLTGKTFMSKLANSYSRSRTRANKRLPFLQTPMMPNVMKPTGGLSGLAQDILSPLSSQVASIASSMQAGLSHMIMGKPSGPPSGLLQSIGGLARQQTRRFRPGGRRFGPARPRPANPRMVHLPGPMMPVQLGPKRGVMGLVGDLSMQDMIGGKSPMPEPLPIHPMIDTSGGVPEPEPISEPGPKLSKKERRKLKKQQKKQKKAAKRQGRLQGKLLRFQRKHAETNKDKFRRKIKKVTKKLSKI